MASVTVSLLGISESSSLSFPLDEFKTFDALHAAIITGFNILVDKVDVALYQNSGRLHLLDEIKEGDISVVVGGGRVREPQGPAGIPFFGNYFDVYPDHVGNYRRLFDTYHRVVKVQNIGRTFYVTNDPEVAKLAFRDGGHFTKAPTSPGHPLHGIEDSTALFLCDTESVAWKEGHKFIPPSLSPKAMRHHLPGIIEAIASSFSILDQTESLGQAFNVFKYTSKLASQVSAKLVLDVDLNHFDSLDTPLHPMMELIERAVKLNTRLQVRGKWYSYLPFGDAALLRQSLKEVYGYIDQSILDFTRKDTTTLPIQVAATDCTCLLDYMLRATDSSGKTMTRHYVRSNTLVLLGAGFITSSAFLSWLVYSFTIYPGVQEPLLQELLAHNATTDKDWTYEELQALPYLDTFVKETQRLHSPSFQPARNARQDVILPGGYHLPAGAILILSLPHLHTNSDHWDGPYRFDPDRWTTARVKERHRSAYVPFAAGARGCIGFNAALLEAKVFVTQLILRYAFVNASEDAIEYDPEFNNIRPSNFYVKVVARTQGSR